ncbi:hypothetical protein IQ268_28245 [Oculatella sp. LEGE 06141]|nr:hypothetical protein [Oculatella sp. LEGE 06141]MBE9182444.1 hypothetical protein [Oculatella sp. LEGE 06141]
MTNGNNMSSDLALLQALAEQQQQFSSLISVLQSLPERLLRLENPSKRLG